MVRFQDFSGIVDEALGDGGDYGEIATKSRISRVKGYILKWEAKLKSARTDFQKRRAERKLAFYKKQLRQIEEKIGRKYDRRERKGKDPRRSMETKAAMLGLDTKTGKKKSSTTSSVDTVEEANEEAKKSGAVLYSLVLRTYPIFVQNRRKVGPEVALMGAVNQAVSEPSLRAPVMAHFKKYLSVYDKAAVAAAGGAAASALTGDRTRAALARNRIRQMQRRAAESRARAQAIQQQQALLARQMQQNQAAQAAAASAAERQRLAAMYQQMLAAQQAQQVQYQQSMAMYQQQAQQVQQAEAQERSGAFQAFPYSSEIQPAAMPGPEFESSEDTTFDPSEASEGAEDMEDMDEGDEGDETPFYKKPLFLVVAVIGGFVGYNQYKKSKKKGGGSTT